MLCGCARQGVGISGAGEDGTEACPSLKGIYPITPGKWGPSPGGQEGAFH